MGRKIRGRREEGLGGRREGMGRVSGMVERGIDRREERGIDRREERGIK